ncbi:hypothetical protein G6F62_008432 [Rhizopus arrhizus]|uniref:Uncharacterized protein n=1 Tax=Rhizopus oryzae TaxID=64495 RepID=A0A9P6XGF9_RHIOR|nr:hypothetical protein G6F23_012662 [Rhizopus arrhizus]KAG0790132.1 hypothetical protein G6F22_006499 [Rhizopus arrhizus]KAG0793562.1 hypothetical protein G6F21_003521 [Rhizopus arrhizus]KAG0814713.1 hypothetical protein G6F20_004557 [Rhizopus arrhizus]KAG0835351.1 hypothetical protein G6F19_004745 [Rhizopus arrhizus]
MPHAEKDNREYITLVSEFSQLIKRYQSIIKQDSVARCMIGFSAAQLIRDPDYSLSVESIESWLQTRTVMDSDGDSENRAGNLDTLISILDRICDESTLEQQAISTKETCSEFS